MAKDPTCGMVVDPETTEFRTVRDGQIYYFCSESCKGKFDRISAQSCEKKSFFTRFLEWIARANQEKYGGNAPSCH